MLAGPLGRAFSRASRALLAGGGNGRERAPALGRLPGRPGGAAMNGGRDTRVSMGRYYFALSCEVSGILAHAATSKWCSCMSVTSLRLRLPRRCCVVAR